MAVTNPTPGTGLAPSPLDAGAAMATGWRTQRRPTGRPAWMEQPSLLTQLAKGLFLAFIALIMLFPIVYVVAVSFSSAKDVLSGGLILWPKNPTLEAYRALLRGGVVRHALLVSVGLVVFGTAA